MDVAHQIGSATQLGDCPKIIVHVYNNAGRWGKGFVVAVSKSWRKPERRYAVDANGDASRTNVLKLRIRP